MEIIIIAAMAENRVIGKDNALPWSLSLKEDMAHFKELTMGWPCIMGRKTWESLPKKPLPGRLNIIISHNAGETTTDCRFVPSLSAAIQLCSGYEKIFVCGGASIYREALALAHKIELTMIRQHYDGDTFFPEIDDACWIKTGVIDFDGFSFISYSRKP